MIEFLKKTCNDFFIIAAGILISSTVFCSIFNPGQMFDLGFMWQIIGMAFFSSLLHFIFYSRKELTKKQMLVRQIIHACVLVALLLTLGYTWGWIQSGSVAQALIFVALIGFVYCIVTVLSFQHDKKVARRLNDCLKQYKSHDSQ